MRGFAVTLTIGLMANVFTAVFVSKDDFRLRVVRARRQMAGVEHLGCWVRASCYLEQREQILKSLVSKIDVGHRYGISSMQIFKNTNYDFLGKKWPFIIASLVLTVAGLSSIVLHGGLRYGIDFKRGAQMTVKWDGRRPRIKSGTALPSKIKGEVSACRPLPISRQERSGDRHRAEDEKQMNINRAGDAGTLERNLRAAAERQAGFQQCRREKSWWTACAIPLAQAGVP